MIAVIRDDDTDEFCREKAAISLRSCLRAAFSDRNCHSDTDITSYLQEIYFGVCETVGFRLSPCSYGNDLGSGGLLGTKSTSGGGAAEKSEEIRLELVGTALDLLSYLELRKDGGEEEGGRPEGIVLLASSLLCEALSSTGLRDPYPELKRECCSCLVALANIAPDIVKDHAEALLLPITGDKRLYDETAHGASNMVSLKCSEACLTRHRHAKTRCLALEATTAVLMCCPSNLPDSYYVSSGEGIHEGNSVCGDMEGNESKTEVVIGTILQSHVLPCWEDILIFDRSDKVRLSLIHAVGKIALRLIGSEQDDTTLHVDFVKNIDPYFARLLVILLLGASDEAVKTHNVAMDTLRDISARVGKVIKPSDTAVAMLMASHKVTLLSILLYAVSKSWDFQRKFRGLQALETLFQMLNISPESSNLDERNVTENNQNTHPLLSHMTDILIVLSACFEEDEHSISSAAASCACALGKNANTALPALGLLLPSLNNGNGEDTPSAVLSLKNISNYAFEKKLLISSAQQYAPILALLGCILKGHTATKNTWMDSTSSSQISAAVGSVAVLKAVSQNQASAWALLDVVQALVECSPVFRSVEGDSHIGKVAESVPSSARSLVFVDVLCCCFQLLGCPTAFGLQDDAVHFYDTLERRSIGVEDKHKLIRTHFREVLKRIRSARSPTETKQSALQVWAPGDYRLHAFDALIRYSDGQAVGHNFDIVAPVLVRHLAGNSSVSRSADCFHDEQPVDYSVKLSIMALVESLVSERSFPKVLLHPFATEMLDSVIMPNLLWKVGGLASSLRKLSAATLFSLLNCGGVTPHNLVLAAPRLLPVLKSNLGDDDASTRELVCSSLGIVFELLPVALSEETIEQMYPELIKCLDDSVDSVRFAACGTLKPFLKSAPPEHLRGTALEYIVEQLLVHMDDSDFQFQVAVLDVLTVTLNVDRTLVITQTKSAMLCHRSMEFCKLLLQRAEEK